MSIEHILTEILNRPLFITPDKLSVILGVLNKKSDNPINVSLSDLLPVIGADRNGEASASAPRAANSSSDIQIAVVPALGSLVYRNGGNPGVGSGLRSYREMQRQITALLKNSDVGGMIIDFNTYGGSAAGCERFARFLKFADEQKPIYGVVDLNCFSAGYYAASACRKVILTDQDAGCGSIGCLAIHRDQSEKDKKDGVTYTAVTFGKYKNDLSPHVPLSATAREKIQLSVDKFGAQFCKTVAEMRGMKVEEIIDTEAGVFYGQEAIDAGLADHIAPFDDAVAMLAEEIHREKNKSFYGGTNMNTKDRMEVLLGTDDGPAAIAELGYLKMEALDQAVEKAQGQVTKVTEEAEAKALETIEIAELCQLADLSVDQTVALLKEGVTPVQAREAIQELRAKKTQKTTIKSNITQLSGDGKHPLIASAEKQASQA